MRGIRMTANGGPEVLEYAGFLLRPHPGPDDVVVELAAAGLNYIDTYQRSGLYQVPLPYTPGLGGLRHDHLHRRRRHRLRWPAGGVDGGARLPTRSR
ncbi:MAG: hypothetical protein R2749_10710 [Acidimicrobiales bacterium]